MTDGNCRLTAKNRDQLRNPTLCNRVWATFTFTFTLYIFSLPVLWGYWHCPHCMQSRVCETVEHLSVPSTGSSSSLQWVCWWAPRGQEISISSRRRCLATNACSVLLTAKARGWTQTCFFCCDNSIWCVSHSLALHIPKTMLSTLMSTVIPLYLRQQSAVDIAIECFVWVTDVGCMSWSADIRRSHWLRQGGFTAPLSPCRLAR